MKKWLLILIVFTAILIFTFRDSIYYHVIFDTNILNKPEHYIVSINDKREQSGKPLLSPEDLELHTTYIGDQLFITTAFVNSELDELFLTKYIDREGFNN